jgi:nucleoside permease NupC
VLWGFANLAVGYVLIGRIGSFNLHANEDVVALGLGILLISVLSARLFGRFHGGNSPGAS